MSVEHLESELSILRRDAERVIPNAATRTDLEALRVDLLGKKGRLTTILRAMGTLGEDTRPRVGKVANEVRDAIQALLGAQGAALEQLAARAEEAKSVDVTLPGRRHARGHVHPITATGQAILDVFASLGFARVDGPEVEHEFYNFEALNFLPDHPARDMQDTFYVDDGVVLRTHTSPVQVRSMLTLGAPPMRLACMGRVYRNDSDATHSPVFHQVEGLYVDTDVTFGDLKGTMQTFVDRIFRPGTPLRLRPSFFPFTEPSAEVDIGCFACDGTGRVSDEGCRLCKATGWIEIMGAGMVDPSVLTASRLDPDRFTGFAFGIGVERVAMLRYGVRDIRLFYENDQRFLRQIF